MAGLAEGAELERMRGADMNAHASSGMERRLVLRLLECWRAAEADGGMPTFDALAAQDLEDIPYSMFLLAPRGRGEPIFKRIGEDLAADVDGDLTGLPISAAPDNTLIAMAVAFYDKVLEKGVPVSLGGEFTDFVGRDVLYRSIILPLQGQSGKIAYLVGAANAKVGDMDVDTEED